MTRPNPSTQAVAAVHAETPGSGSQGPVAQALMTSRGLMIRCQPGPGGGRAAGPGAQAT